jgi:hypothetical protein
VCISIFVGHIKEGADVTVGEYRDELPAEFQKPQYQWWRKALARNRLPIHDGELRCGLYRWGNRAVAIWQTGGQGYSAETHVTYNGAPQFVDNVLEHWPHISKEPVTPQTYMACRDAGWKWPGGNAVVDAMTMTPVGSKPPVLGSNEPPADDSPAMLSAQLDELEREAKRLIEAGAAKSQAQVNEAARVADKIASVQKAALELHQRSKAPVLEQGRAIDRLWFPLRDRADELKRLLKGAVVTPFLIADEERRRKENVAMVAAGIAPEAIVNQGAKASGGTRTTSLRTVTSANITGYYELLEHLRDHPAIKGAVQDIADRSAKAGVQLPGMLIVKTRSAV